MNKGGVKLIKTLHLSLPSLIGSDQRASVRTPLRELILGYSASWVFLKLDLKNTLKKIKNKNKKIKNTWFLC